MRFPVVCAAALALCLPAVGAQAHHSMAMFDQTKTVVINGTVKQFQWTNPHCYIQLVVDGTDPDLVAAVLDAENEAMRKRHAAGRAPFMQAGALAPTMGIVGTVFGLVNVMNNLNRGLGLPDGYPFVLSAPTIDKLRFVHETILATSITTIQR